MRPGAPSDEGLADGGVSSTTRIAGCRCVRRASLWKSTCVTALPRAAKRFDNSHVTVETGPMSDVPMVPLVATSIIFIVGPSWALPRAPNRHGVHEFCVVSASSPEGRYDWGTTRPLQAAGRPVGGVHNHEERYVPPPAAARPGQHRLVSCQRLGGRGASSGLAAAPGGLPAPAVYGVEPAAARLGLDRHC